MFLIEGIRELSRAMDKNIAVDSIFFCEDFFNSGIATDLILRGKEHGIEICRLSKDVFEKISNREGCDGVIGLANFWETSLSDIAVSEDALLLVAEGIEKPGNLGAIMRSAESVGANGLILCNPVTDIFNPHVIRASQGAVFSLSIAIANNEDALSFLEQHSLKIFATTPSSPNVYFNEDFTTGIAIVIGSEHSGLSDFWLSNNKVGQISIPQAGISDSLNVNDAAVVILYEALRQRRQNCRQL
jgi:TrmH family RNA methyltransferase